MNEKRNCERCKIELIIPRPMQRYCPVCSEIRDMERKSAQGGKNPVKGRKRGATLLIERQERRAKINSEKTHSIADVGNPIDDVDLERVVRIAVPFDYGYSKNAIYSLTGGGHVFLRQKTRRLRETIYYGLKAAMGEMKFYNAKVYIDIFVEKPNHKGDAINVLDTVCDGIKDAIGVDDRWFSVRSLDWSIVKEGGRLFIGVSQPATEDERSCHRCGRFFPLSNFAYKSGRLGRVCRECRRDKPLRSEA